MCVCVCLCVCVMYMYEAMLGRYCYGNFDRLAVASTYHGDMLLGSMVIKSCLPAVH